MNTVGTLSECMLVYPCHALIFVTDMFHKAIMKLANICEIGIISVKLVPDHVHGRLPD